VACVVRVDKRVGMMVPSGFCQHLPGSLVLAALLVVLAVSRVGGAHRVSDAVGALCDTRSHSTSELIGLEVRPMPKM
jgi:hypothetical protein